MSVPVSLDNDLTALVYLPLSLHTSAPPCPVGPDTLHVEVPVPMRWDPGAAKMTSNVFHQSRLIALDGHDCGNLIIHWALPPWPPNPLLLIHIPFSSRKANFSASTVKMNGAPAALASWRYVMTACMDPLSLPVAVPVTTGSNTVFLGATGVDVALGLFGIVVGLGTDIFGVVTGGEGPESVIGELANKLIGVDLPKTCIGIMTNVVKIAVTGEGDIELVNVGSSYGGGKVTLSRNEDGEWSAGWEVNVGSAKIARSYDETGTDTTEDEITLFGKRYKRTREEDSAGNVTITDETAPEHVVPGQPPRTTTRRYDRDGRLLSVESNREAIELEPNVDPAAQRDALGAVSGGEEAL